MVPLHIWIFRQGRDTQTNCTKHSAVMLCASCAPCVVCSLAGDGADAEFVSGAGVLCAESLCAGASGEASVA